MKRSAQQSSFAVLVGLSILLPLVNYYRVLPSSTLYSEAVSAILFLGAAAVGGTIVAKRSSVHGSIVLFVAVLFSLLIYQTVSGQHEYLLSLSGWYAYLLIFFIAAIIGQAAAEDPPFRELLVDRVTSALLAAALFNSFAQTAQVTGWADSIRLIVFIPAESIYQKYKCSPAGNVAQLNHTNVLAWLGLCSLIYQLAARRVRFVVAFVGIALLLLSSAMTSARMAWLMAFAVASLLIVGRESLGWSNRRSYAMAAMILLGLVAATVAKKVIVGDECQTSLDRALDPDQQLDYWVRIELMRQALMVWWSQPLLGVGVGNFMAAAFLLEPNLDSPRPLDYFPHNAPLEILASFGAIGGAALLYCGFVWTVRAFAFLDSSTHQWPMVAGVAVLLIHALLEMPLWYAFFLIPFGLMLGVAVGPATPPGWSLRLPARPMFVACVLVGIPGFAYVLVDHAKAERALWLSGMARQNKVVSGAAVEQLAKLTGELTVFRIAAERELLRFAEIDRSNLAGLTAANSRLLHSMPDPLTIARQILLESMAGNADESRDLLRRLIAFYPKSWEELVGEMREKIDAHPEEFGTLSRILTEEVARAPREQTGNLVPDLH